jgi:hypothetical protein
MRSMLVKLALSTFLLSVALGACSQENVGTPAPSSGPAFVAFPRQRPCGDDVCVRARVENHGDQAGTGTCQLLGTHQDANSVASTIGGPTLTLPVVAAGDSVKQTARWPGAAPNGGLQLHCEPGVRM